MSYPFIDLDKSKKSEIILHLKNHCGIEKKETDSKDDLIAAVLEFEENNGFNRPSELMPKILVTTESDADAVEEKESAVNLGDNLNDYPKVKIKISTGLGFDGAEDVIVWLNGRSFQMQREKEVVVPEPVYQLLMDSTSVIGSQKKDGEIERTVVQNYNIHFLGYVN